MDEFAAHLPPGFPESAHPTEDRLIQDVVRATAPPLAAVVTAAAVPITFDVPLLGALLARPQEAFALAERLVGDYSFISRINGHYRYYAPARRAILALARQQDAAGLRALNATAASYFETQSKTLPPGPEREGAERAYMYHLLGAGGTVEALGYSELLRLFAEAESAFRLGVAHLLLRLAEEQVAELDDEHRTGLRWLEGRLLILQGRAKEAAKTLKTLLDDSPLSKQRPEIELTLAHALCDAGRWADAIVHAQAAERAFRAANRHFDQARALIRLSAAYSGLARSVRGTRSARPPVANRWLNILNELGILIERLPILAYLMFRLGPRIVLPAVNRVARDQDWVVARLFVSAAVFLGRASAALRVAVGADLDRRTEIEQIQRDVGLALSTLYRTLGHPAHAADLLEEQLYTSALRDNPYRQASVRLRLGEALLDAGNNQLATDELRAALMTLSEVKDIGGEAQARLLLGKALLETCVARAESRPEHLRAATDELLKSQQLYAQLDDKAAQAEVGRLLDSAAAYPGLPPDDPARVQARAAAAGFTERRFPVRYTHPAMKAFRILGLAGLALAFVLILFGSIRTGTDTAVGATAVIQSSPLLTNSADFTPTISVMLPDQQLMPRFQASFALRTSLALLFVYVLAYTAVGLGLISLSSPETLRSAQPGAIVLDDAGIRYESGSPDGGHAEDGERATKTPCSSAISWAGIREAFTLDRMMLTRPFASYSRLRLFGDGAEVTVPGQTVGYEGELRERILARLPVRSKRLGYSILAGWMGPMALLALAALGVLLVGGAAHLRPATHAAWGWYSLTDLHMFLHVLILAPLVWLLVGSPLREALVLSPQARWPLGIGGAGIAIEAFFLRAPTAVNSWLAAPRIYPVLIGATLAAAACVFVLLARRYQDLPSRRLGPVYQRPWRMAAAVLLIVTIGAAAAHVGREIRGYDAVVRGNQWRDWAEGLAHDRAIIPPGMDIAAGYYRESLRLAPHVPAVMAQLGAVLSRAGRYDEAIAQYSAAIGEREWAVLYANRAVARQYAAQMAPAGSYTATQQLEDAAKDYDQALKLKPHSVEYRLRQATLYQQLKRFDDAIRVYTDTLRLAPDNPDALAGRGWAYFQVGEARRLAEKEQEEQAKHAPDEQSAHALNLAKEEALRDKVTAYLRAWADFEQAAVLLGEKTQALAPGDSQVLALSRQLANVENGLAMVALKLEQNAAALEHFERAARHEPTNGDYQISAGNVHWLLAGGEPTDQSTSAYREAFRRHIESSVAAYEQALQRGLSWERRNISYLYRTLGQFHFLLRDQRGHDFRQELEAAIASHDRAIALLDDPGYRELRGRIHRLLAETISRDDWQAARQHYEIAIEDLEVARGAGRTDVANVLSITYMQLGWRLHKFGDETTAIGLLHTAVRTDPQYAIPRFTLAVLYLYTGDIAQARVFYAEALRVAAGNPADQANAAYDDALSDLQNLKATHPELADIADDISATINQARK